MIIKLNSVTSRKRGRLSGGELFIIDIGAGLLVATTFMQKARRVTFAAGESSKTFPVLIIDNAYTDGNQNLNLFLQEPVAARLATPGRAVLTIVDNDTTVATSNPVDNTAFFVRQHYYDFSVANRIRRALPLEYRFRFGP